MVNDQWRDRADLHSANVMSLLQRIRQDKIAKDVGPGSSQCKWPLHGKNQIRRAILPGFAVHGRLWRCGRIAFRHAAGNPLCDLRNLFAAKPSLIRKLSITGLRQPRRHIPRRRDAGHLWSPSSRVLVGEQAEGTRATGMMTGGAVAIDQGSNLARPGN